MSDTLIQLLAGLPAGELDAERAERIRTRCRARLERQKARAPVSTITFRPIWRLAVSVLGAAYLIDAIVEAVRAYNLS